MTTSQLNLGPLSVNGVTQSEAIQAVEEFIRGGVGGYVVTPNVDHIVLASRSAALRKAYQDAALSLADGQPVLWMSKLLGSPLPEKVSGSDLIGPLMAHASRNGWRVFLFGGRADVSADAERRLLERYPGLRIVGRDTSAWHPDHVLPASQSPVVRAIRSSGADLVIVALGCPKQELWMHRHARALGGVVALGLGGSLDFVAGAIRRAPRWMCDAGLEWLFRLLQEPRRLAHRYLVRDTQIIPIFLRQMVRRAQSKLAPVESHNETPSTTSVPERDPADRARGIAAGEPGARRRPGRGQRHVRTIVVVGSESLARHTADDLGARDDVRVAGVFTLDGETTHPALAASVLGHVSELRGHLTRHPVDEVYLSAEVGRHYADLQSAVDVCERFGVPFAVSAHAFRLGRAMPTGGHRLGDGYIHYQTTVSRPFQQRLKRGIDVALSGMALAGLLPLFLIVAATIKLTSKGPVFFKQVRVGQHGRTFSMLKFRSMVADAENLRDQLAALNEQQGPVFKIKQDPRITPIGRILRKFSIDELPQLINVLVGDMSIVGPRPPLPKEVEQYAAWQRRRLSVRPGLTCYWQVQGRNTIGFEEWMYLDLQYVDQWSLLKDFRLIARTIPVVLSGAGAS